MGAVNLACIDDDAAKEHANRLAVGHQVELWRLVARFKFAGRPAATRRPHPGGHVSAISTIRLSDRTSLECGCRFAAVRCRDVGVGLSGAVGAALDNGARFHFQSLKADDAEIAAVPPATSLSDTCRDWSVVDAAMAHLGQRIGRAHGTVEHPGRQLRPLARRLVRHAARKTSRPSFSPTSYVNDPLEPRPPNQYHILADGHGFRRTSGRLFRCGCSTHYLRVFIGFHTI